MITDIKYASLKWWVVDKEESKVKITFGYRGKSQFNPTFAFRYHLPMTERFSFIRFTLIPLLMEIKKSFVWLTKNTVLNSGSTKH